MIGARVAKLEDAKYILEGRLGMNAESQSSLRSLFTTRVLPVERVAPIPDVLGRR